jgi:CheY-like chemotaxis protein
MMQGVKRTAITKELFASYVVFALRHYHDTARLQLCPLIGLLALDHSENAPAALRQVIRAGIDQLRPAPEIPFGEPPWLIYRLIRLRYIESRSILDTCQDLGCSTASFYRYQRAALDALVELMWTSYKSCQSVSSSASEFTNETPGQQDVAQAVRVARGTGFLSVDPHLLTRSMLEITRQMTCEKGILVHCELEPSLPLVHGDPAMLLQILLDMMRGSLSGAADTGLEVSVRTQATEIIWRVSGLDEARLLGQDPLVIMGRVSQALLREYRGHAWWEATGKREVAFCVGLPAESPRRILIVDDDADTCLLYCRYLEPQFTACAASSWAEVKTRLDDTKVDLILLDMLMPVEGGWTILQRLRADTRTAQVPIIVCSVLDQPQLAISLGADLVLRKPVDPAALVRAIRTTLAPGHA